MGCEKKFFKFTIFLEKPLLEKWLYLLQFWPDKNLTYMESIGLLWRIHTEHFIIELQHHTKELQPSDVKIVNFFPPTPYDKKIKITEAKCHLLAISKSSKKVSKMLCPKYLLSASR